ncbi:MAG: prepilin peptidase [Clostridia bacterium]|nr:prepilin peptidase [Clostridia bacterium]
MDIFFYVIIFIIGSLFGSFYTLAVYRIPKRQDILLKHSYCPNCNHKLGLLDLFPIFSYILLGGKCRYCKEKIRPRYLVLEVLAGMLFVVIAYLTGLNLEHLSLVNIIEYVCMILYITFIILIVGIDAENKNIDKAVNVYGIVVSIIYMLYLCIVEKANIYRYGIYLVLYIIVLTLDTITLRKFAKSTYLNGLLIMITTMAVFTGEYITIISIIYTLLLIAIDLMINKIKNRKNKNVKNDKQVAEQLCIGTYLGVTNLITVVFVLFMNYILNK